MCRINPRVDLAFKKLFGSEENKDLLISLINAIVPDEDQVADIELRNPCNLVDYRAGKLSILDIKAYSLVGRWYNVEMQISEDLYKVWNKASGRDCSKVYSRDWSKGARRDARPDKPNYWHNR